MKDKKNKINQKKEDKRVKEQLKLQNKIEKRKQKRQEEKSYYGLNKTPKRRNISFVIFPIIIAIAISLFSWYLTNSGIVSLVTLVFSIILLVFYFVAIKNLKEYAKIKKMELVFPDFLQLMSSNLRAGMTTDKALLLSSRKEFAPLDVEINQLGKDLITGKQIDMALRDMSRRIKSKKIEKTTSLIISGIRSGGDIATLLDQTASNMRERIFIEKKSASNVLMYVIFIIFAIAVGAPTLFSLSAVLVEVLTGILSNLPQIQSSLSLPFTLTSVTISISFITYFSIAFLIATDILGALVIGQVARGQSKEGIKYIVPLIVISVIIFITVKYLLLQYFKGFVG